MNSQVAVQVHNLNFPDQTLWIAHSLFLLMALAAVFLIVRSLRN